MAYEALIYEVNDRVAIITLNRPQRLNAFSLALRDEIVAAVKQADEDPAVRVLIITGAGEARSPRVTTSRNRPTAPSARSRSGATNSPATAPSPIRCGIAPSR